jgi:hypothetical protein
VAVVRARGLAGVGALLALALGGVWMGLEGNEGARVAYSIQEAQGDQAWT